VIQGQVSLYFLQTIEAAMRAGVLATPKMGLYTNTPFTPSVSTLLGTLTQPTFTGYALATLAIQPLQSNVNSDQIDTFGVATFQPTGAVSPAQIAQGAFLQATVTAVDHLLQTTPLATPFTFNAATDALSIMPEVIFPNLKVFGGICSTCP
jgi:hypothetical protein